MRTCEQMIDESKKFEIGRLEFANEFYNESDISEGEIEEKRNEGLVCLNEYLQTIPSMDVITENFDFHMIDVPNMGKWVRFELSGGGPADGFYVLFIEREAIQGIYWYQNWFDGAKRSLSIDEVGLFNVFGDEFQHISDDPGEYVPYDELYTEEPEPEYKFECKCGTGIEDGNEWYIEDDLEPVCENCWDKWAAD